MIFGTDYFGFVYIWRDRKHGRYYIGSHFGALDDGYICGSKRMRTAYFAREQDFKRRILYWLPEPNRKFMLLMEQRWLNLIPINQLSKRYYNHIRDACGGGRTGYKPSEETKRKIGLANSKPHTSRRAKEAHKRHAKRMTGRMASEQTKKKMSLARMGKKWDEKRKEYYRQRKAEGKFAGWNKGGTWTAAQRAGRLKTAEAKKIVGPAGHDPASDAYKAPALTS